MAHIGFVSTSVLESKDGIDFNEDVRKESEEVLEAERIAKEADKKPLWEQLAGKRDEKQAKFDAVRAGLFAPPRALDDEESNFLQGVEAQRLEAKKRKEEWEAEELRGFEIARANQMVAIAEPKKPKPKPSTDEARGDKEQEPARRTPPPVVAVKIKAKRKKGKDKGKDDKRAKKKATTGAAVGDDSVGVSSKRGDKTSDKNKSEEGASATGRTGKGQGRRKEDDGGDDDDDDDKKPDLTNKSEEDNKGLASLLGAYESDSDDGSA